MAKRWQLKTHHQKKRGGVTLGVPGSACGQPHVARVTVTIYGNEIIEGDHWELYAGRSLRDWLREVKSVAPLPEPVLLLEDTQGLIAEVKAELRAELKAELKAEAKLSEAPEPPEEPAPAPRAEVPSDEPVAPEPAPEPPVLALEPVLAEPVVAEPVVSEPEPKPAPKPAAKSAPKPAAKPAVRKRRTRKTRTTQE